MAYFNNKNDDDEEPTYGPFGDKYDIFWLLLTVAAVVFLYKLFS